MVVIAILALILIPSLSGYKTKADRSKDEANARNIYTAATLLLDEKEVVEATTDKGTVIKTKIASEGLVDTKQISNWDTAVKIEVDDKGKITVKVGDVTYPTDKTTTP